MSKSVLGRGSTHSEPSPNVRLRVQHSDIVQVALLESGTLVVTAGTLHLLLIEPEATVDDEVGANQDGAMSLSGAGSRTCRMKFGD